MLNLANGFEVEGVVKNSAVLKEQNESPYYLDIGWTRIGPRNSTPRAADTRDSPCCLGRYLLSIPQFARHVFLRKVC
jgi:hypothetical protein